MKKGKNAEKVDLFSEKQTSGSMHKMGTRINRQQRQENGNWKKNIPTRRRNSEDAKIDAPLANALNLIVCWDITRMGLGSPLSREDF